MAGWSGVRGQARKKRESLLRSCADWKIDVIAVGSGAIVARCVDRGYFVRWNGVVCYGDGGCGEAAGVSANWLLCAGMPLRR